MLDAPRLIGFVGKQPERLACLLRRFSATPWILAAEGVRPWGVGQYTGEQTIRRTQSGRLKVDLALGDLLLAGGSSPMLIARAAPMRAATAEDEQPFRCGSWFVALQGEVTLDGERAAWAADLPPFLVRARHSRSDAELLFLQLMTRLHAARLLDPPFADPDAAALILGRVASAVDPPVNLLATNGRTLFACRASRPLSYCTFAGIAACARCRVGDGFTRFQPSAQAHSAFRGVCVASARFDSGETWQEVPQRAVLVVGLAAHARLVELDR